MSRISAILLILFVLSACSAPKPAPTQAPGRAPTLALLHAPVIDGTGAEPISDAAVLLAGDTILSVGPAGNVTIPASVQTLDLTGMTLLPGFINAHVHRGFSKDNLKAWAEGGVTTVRDEGASSSQLAGLKAFQAE